MSNELSSKIMVTKSVCYKRDIEFMLIHSFCVQKLMLCHCLCVRIVIACVRVRIDYGEVYYIVEWRYKPHTRSRFIKELSLNDVKSITRRLFNGCKRFHR